MPRNGDADLFAELRKIDTPSITNVVAPYPTNPVCLGLYNPWSENWYTDTSIRCMYPELGAVAGYAVTCVYSVPDPNYNRLTFMDVIDALDASPKPTILVLQQKFPPELAAKAGLAGEIVHMDENGACKFPADKIEAVLANVKVLLKDEATRLTALRQAKTAAEVRAAFSGGAYSDPKNAAPKR